MPFFERSIISRLDRLTARRFFKYRILAGAFFLVRGQRLVRVYFRSLEQHFRGAGFFSTRFSGLSTPDGNESAGNRVIDPGEGKNGIDNE